MGGAVSASGEAYVKSYRGLRTFVEEGSTLPSGEMQDTGRRLSRGVDMSLDWRGSRTDVSGSVSLSRAVERSSADSVQYPSSFDYRYAATLSAARLLAGGWRVATRWRLVGGRPYTEFRVVELPWGAYDFIPGGVTQNRARYPSYRRLDIQVTRAVHWRASSLGLFAELQNALGRQNVHSWRFNRGLGEFEPVHQFPRLFVVGVTASLPRE